MQDIETIAINNYQDNLVYFQNNHSSLYNKILALDTILADGSYPQKYDLEYKDGYFDVVDLKSNTMLYNQDSNKLSQQLGKNVNLQKNLQSFKCHRKFVFDKETLELYKTQNAYTDYISVANIMDYYYNNSDDSMHMNKINKYIFLGSGLGLHIENIVTNFDIPISLIIEDDIELFRLSLFTTDYSKVFQRRHAFFSIAENNQEFHKTFSNFYTKAFFKNQFIKYSLFSSAYEQKVDEIRSLLISRPEATYSNERILVKNAKVLQKIKDNYKFLNLRKKTTETFFKDKPWIVVGAGPSLHKNIGWLKANKDNYIIITPLAALKSLKKADISPDIVVHIEESESSTKKMLDNIGNIDFLKDSIFIFSASTSQSIFETFERERIYLHEDRTKYKLGDSTLAVTSVGETIYSIALIFNSPSVYLLGLDLALGDEGETHSSDHFKSTKVQEKNNKNDDFQLSDNIVYVKGNLKDKVKSLPIFVQSIPVVNFKTQEYKSQDQKVYNLSENGAYFEDTIPLDISKIKNGIKLDKDSIKKDFTSLFDKYSTDELSQLEIEQVDLKISQVMRFKKLLESFKTSPSSNDDTFLESFENLVSSVFQDKYRYELWEIFTIYFLRICSHVDDLLNTVEIKNKKKHTKKLKQFLVKQIEKIILTYEDDLKKLKTTEVV